MRFALKVDPRSAVPLWHQIELGIKRLVSAGALRPAAQVPSVRDLARELRINPATVVKAYQTLTEAGLLEVRRGEGTFVLEAPAPPGLAARRSQLREVAGHYAGAALGLGAPLEEAVQELRAAWPPPARAAERRNDDDR